MQAPAPKSPPELAHERVRCSCHTETFVVFPKRWYHGQAELEAEQDCPSCGRWLLAYTHPEGAVVAHYALHAVPDEVARALGPEVAEELLRGRSPAITEGVPERWYEPHEAPQDYVDWVAASQVPPAPFMERRLVIQNLAITAVLVVLVALLALT